MNPLLSEREQALVKSARAAVRENVAPLAGRIDAESRCPTELLDQLRVAGLLAVDTEGGLCDLALVVEEVARASAAVATIVGAHAAPALHLAGVGGAPVGMMAVSVSEQPVIRATATDADGYRLDGELSMVAGAVTADELVLSAQTDSGPALFRVARDAAGLTVGSEPDLLGLRGCGAASVTLEGVEVGAEARVGDAAAVETLADRVRVLQAARSVGVVQAALDEALADVARRRDAGDRIDRSQSIQWMLADIATETEAARVSTWHAATREPGPELSQTAAGCRLLAAEAAAQGARRALQVFGDRGALREAGVERIYRDAKLMEIEGGTNEDQLRRVAALLLPELSDA